MNENSEENNLIGDVQGFNNLFYLQHWRFLQKPQVRAHSSDGSVHVYGFKIPVKYSLKIHKDEMKQAPLLWALTTCLCFWFCCDSGAVNSIIHGPFFKLGFISSGLLKI